MNCNHPPLLAVREAVSRALAEDLGPLGDLTAALLPVELHAEAVVVPRGEGTLAGRLCAHESFAAVDPAIRVEWQCDDGDDVVAGEVVARVEGPLTSILTAERTALNFLGHLSGVATLTRAYVRAARGKARIRDTRKTSPGLRALEKAAVRAGGGVNHRGNLSDGVLVKDNHLGEIAIAEAVRRAHLRWPGRSVQVECDRLEQVQEALNAGADLVMCDNMTPEQVRECVDWLAGRLPVEVSGGVTLQTVGDYAEAGATFISVGALTHSAPVLDLGLDLATEVS